MKVYRYVYVQCTYFPSKIFIKLKAICYNSKIASNGSCQMIWKTNVAGRVSIPEKVVDGGVQSLLGGAVLPGPDLEQRYLQNMNTIPKYKPQILEEVCKCQFSLKIVCLLSTKLTSPSDKVILR